MRSDAGFMFRSNDVMYGDDKMIQTSINPKEKHLQIKFIEKKTLDKYLILNFERGVNSSILQFNLP